MSDQPQVDNSVDTVTPESDQDKGGGSATDITVKIIIGFIIFLVVTFVLAFLLAFFRPQAASGVALIRDFFIIVLVLEGMMIGMALIVLVMQLARLINLLQNEIKPIIEETSDTVKTVKGTASFVSHNVVDPVIKVGGFVSWLGAVIAQVLAIFRIAR